MLKHFALFIGLSSALLACGTMKNGTSKKITPSKNGIITLLHGTSYGHCRGPECIKEETYSSNGIATLNKGWDTTEIKPIVGSYAFTAKEFETLTATVDFEKWNALPDKIGCPDCTDRGSEYVTIVTKKGTKTVVFDSNSDVEDLKDLLILLRAKRKEIEKSRQNVDE